MPGNASNLSSGPPSRAWKDYIPPWGAPDVACSSLIEKVYRSNDAARLALGITPACLRRSLPAADLLGTAENAIESLASAERGVLQRALARVDGNVTAAAEALGMSRATFYRKLRRRDVHGAH
jgi:transcriptional regulator of acetoin/glycerol metabolism